jgi:5-methyltetrahydrofolate--homocysteine methyltransferase
MDDFPELYNAVVRGDADLAKSFTERALAACIEPLRLVNEAMIPAMDEVGARFERSEYFVPQMLLSTRAMKQSMALIRPLLTTVATKPLGRVVIGTVKGDMHDIGKNLVAAMLEGGGFEVTDLGTNVSAEKFVAVAIEKKAQIVGMSALLTTTMAGMRGIIEALAQAGLRPGVKVLVGGAPVSRAFAENIGADGHSNSAPDAVKVAKRVLGLADATWQNTVAA